MKQNTRPGSLALAFILALILPYVLAVPAHAQEPENKVVRVGWYDSPFNYLDSFGRRSGYAYEYQRKVAAYTGWQYEYVEGTWPELLDMLKAGEIDLMSDVSYTEERAGEMLFAALPMGAETYHVFIAATNTEITAANMKALNGKRVGVNKNSVQKGLFLQWAEENGIHADIVELSVSQDETVQMLERGEIDALITIDWLGEEPFRVPVFKIGQSEFYFAVNKARRDLLDELNAALSKIHDEDRYYNQQMYDRFIQRFGTNAYLAAKEVNWLHRHGTIRVGYLDDYLPFCATDAESGELTGALKEYLKLASRSTKNAEITFETVPYATQEDAFDALRTGSIDCVFPVCLSTSDGEDMGVLVTTPFMETEIYAAVQKSDHLGISPDREMKAALGAVNFNNETFLKDHFPDWEAVHYQGAEACYRAVASGEADCVLVSNYRLANTEALREQYKLSALTTGAAMNFSFAIREADSELYYILNKTASIVPDASVNSALMTYSWPDNTFFMTEFLKDHLFLVISVMLLVTVSVVLYLVHRAAQIKADLEQETALHRALSDALTAAEEENRAKTVFLSNMSHDIRTPMNAIIGFTNLALRNPADTERVTEYLVKIEASSSHLLALINDVLEMSRIESGKIELDESLCSLPEILHDLNTIIVGQVEAKQQELTMDAVDVVNENVYCDKLRLNQVLLNLLSNAVKYTPAGGKISVRVIQRTGEHDGCADYELRVKDTGIGMSPEFAKKVFDAFEREKTSTVSGIQGTGLGMAITKSIIDLMNGSIRVETEPGKGSEFIVDVSMKVETSGVRDRHIPELSGLRALVVDDDFHTCDSTTKLLSQLGMRSDWTLSGKEAVLRAKHANETKDHFKVFLIDWKLPDLNGIEAVRQIRAAVGPNVPILLMTAYDWPSIKDEAIAAGVNGFCNKPLFLSELHSAMMRVIGKADSAETRVEDKTPPVNFEGRRLLLVDDIEMNREIAVAVLEMSGFEVEEARDGTEAVEKVTNAAPGYYDAVLMDIQMPVMNGYEAARKIRASDSQNAAIPIVAMTANAFDEDKNAAYDAGMNGHVAKPIDVEKLMKVLGKILHQK